MTSSTAGGVIRRILESVGVENRVILNFEGQDVTAEMAPTLWIVCIQYGWFFSIASGARAAENATFGYP